jgi:hypothetical protein
MDALAVRLPEVANTQAEVGRFGPPQKMVHYFD